MSLANVFVQGERGWIQADAAATLPDGTVAWIGPKLFPVGTLKAAVTVRGQAGETFGIMPTLLGSRRWTSVQEFLAHVPELMERMTRYVADAYDWGGAEPIFCWYIVAYSEEQRRPIGYMIANDAAWFDGKVAAYTYQPILHTIGSTVPVRELIGREPVFSDPADFDVARDSLALIEAQRATPWADFPRGSVPGAKAAVRIGGWVDQVEVSARGLLWRRLVEWPEDRVGRSINTVQKIGLEVSATA